MKKQKRLPEHSKQDKLILNSFESKLLYEFGRCVGNESVAPFPETVDNELRREL